MSRETSTFAKVTSAHETDGKRAPSLAAAMATCGSHVGTRSVGTCARPLRAAHSAREKLLSQVADFVVNSNDGLIYEKAGAHTHGPGPHLSRDRHGGVGLSRREPTEAARGLDRGPRARPARSTYSLNIGGDCVPSAVTEASIRAVTAWRTLLDVSSK